MNVGHNIQDDLSIYGVAGYNAVAYDVLNGTHKDTVYGISYGLGIRYNINDTISTKVEYNTQNIELEYNDPSEKEDTDINLIKLGIAYHF